MPDRLTLQRQRRERKLRRFGERIVGTGSEGDRDDLIDFAYSRYETIEEDDEDPRPADPLRRTRG